MAPSAMRTDLFDFALPEDRIALRPATPRDSARLLVVRPGAATPFEDRVVRDLPELLRAGDAVVVNDTKVFPARLHGRRIGRGESEPAIAATLTRRLDGSRWNALVKPGRKMGVGERVEISDNLSAVVLDRGEFGERTVRLETTGDVFEELERLKAAGESFDIVLADPPPFVKSKKDLEPGAKAYRKLARLAADVTAPGGVLMVASCSHNIPPERFAAECAQGLLRAGRKAAMIRQAGAGPDHPVHPLLPESAYLKAIVYALD